MSTRDKPGWERGGELHHAFPARNDAGANGRRVQPVWDARAGRYRVWVHLAQKAHRKYFHATQFSLTRAPR